MPAQPRWRRVLLKLSGEALAGNGYGIDPEVLGTIAEDVRETGAPKRTLARGATLGVNAAGIGVMLATFSATGGLTGVEVGVAAAAHRLDPAAVLGAYLHSFAANLVSAAVRLIPLGQTDGQRALNALMPVVDSVVPCALACPLEDCGTAAPMVDLTSMLHETQYTRLFRS